MKKWQTVFCLLYMVPAIVFSQACEDQNGKGVAHNKNKAAGGAAAKIADQLAWNDPPQARELDQLGGDDFREIVVGKSERMPDCASIFEESKIGESKDSGEKSAPKAQYPLSNTESGAMSLGGCAPEAYLALVFSDEAGSDEAGSDEVGSDEVGSDEVGSDKASTNEKNGRLIAYAVDEKEGGASDLRLVYYAEDGALGWHSRLDRSGEAKNFRANFRGSFIAPLLPRMVCFGTLWQGGTQAQCVAAETGELVWTGKMDFWAGMAPRAVGSSLVSATLNGLTQRYPYSGVEMRTKGFYETGGRTSLYLSDARSLFFASSRAKTPLLIRYGLEDFKTRWALELPGAPTPEWGDVFEQFGVLLIKIDDTIYALNIEDGTARWSLKIGQDKSPLVAHGDHIYLLVRRDTRANLLLKIDPASGAIAWVSETPTGSLDLLSIDQTLMLKSVRAVQVVDIAAQ